MTFSNQSIDALVSSKKILVLGPSGSGKTYLTCRLSQILGKPAIHLDARFWRPDWVSTPQAEWRRKVVSLIQQEYWIMDGTYESTLDLRIAAAELIIMVARPRWACLWGVITRSIIHRNRPRPDAPPGQPIDLAFLRYIWWYPTRTHPLVNALIKEHGQNKPVVILNGRKNIEVLMSALQRRNNGVVI